MTLSPFLAYLSRFDSFPTKAHNGNAFQTAAMFIRVIINETADPIVQLIAVDQLPGNGSSRFTGADDHCVGQFIG